jgi:hypothetical protein
VSLTGFLLDLLRDIYQNPKLSAVSIGNATFLVAITVFHELAHWKCMLYKRLTPKGDIDDQSVKEGGNPWFLFVLVRLSVWNPCC